MTKLVIRYFSSMRMWTARVHDLTYLYDGQGERLGVDVTRYNTWSSETVDYSLNVHEDIMGSGMYYTRPDTGYISNKHTYDSWGYNSKAPTYNYDPEYRATEPYFTGHPYDGSLNLYYAENRFYDAQTGAFLSKDPVRDGFNWYSYCGNNPTTYVDPLGLYVTDLNGDGVADWRDEELSWEPQAKRELEARWAEMEVLNAKPDNFPSMEDVCVSKDLESGRLSLTGCGYQARKTRQTMAFGQIMLDYLQNDAAGQAYVQKVHDALFIREDEFGRSVSAQSTEYCMYYLLASELLSFNYAWEDHYKGYEKAEKKKEKALKRQKDHYITRGMQESFAQSVMSMDDILLIAFCGSDQERAFLDVNMQNALAKATIEELIEEGIGAILAVLLPYGMGLVAQAADAVGDTLQTFRRVDKSLDVADNMMTATKNLNMLETMSDVENHADLVRSIDNITESMDQARHAANTQEAVEVMSDGIRGKGLHDADAIETLIKTRVAT